MQLAIIEIEAGCFGGEPRYDHRAIIFLGQALQVSADVHHLANGRNDLSRCGPIAPTTASPKWMPIPMRNGSLCTPRDFDVSPYFQIVKPGLTDNFNHRLLDWIDLVRDPTSGNFVDETSNPKLALE